MCMRITNNSGLPECLVDLIKADQKPPIENRFSVTQIIGNIPELLLNRKYYDYIDLDVSDCVNTIFGTAVHDLIEKFDKTGMAEYDVEYSIGQYTIAGRIDLYDETTHTLIDWKTASSFKVKKGDFSDYKKQGLVYAWLLLKNGIIVDKLAFYVFIKDWNERCEFPHIYKWEYKVTINDLIYIEQFLNDQLSKITTYDIDNLPKCEDTWYTGDKYAIYSKSNARADRVFDSEQEAHDYITNHCGGVGRIEIRKGQHRKCQNYCTCRSFCKYWKEREVE